MSWFRKALIFLGVVVILGLVVHLIQERILIPSPTTSQVQEEQEKTLTIGWVGDMVPADFTYNQSIFDFVQEKTNTPDLMIGNLEATFAENNRRSKCSFLLTRCYAFRGDTNFADALKSAGFDVISLVNNHSLDYGEEGLHDTEKILKNRNIPFISKNTPTLSLEKNGYTIGILGLSTTPPERYFLDYEYIQKEVALLRENHDIVIVIFHGGSEGSTKTEVTGIYEFVGTEPRGNVERSAKTAIDAGADIVLGAGPHVLRKVEYYNNGFIVYSAGNFVGGNERLLTRGNLGISGIFTVTVSNKTPRLRHNIDSVLLTKEGVPYIDPTEQGRLMVEALSQ